MEGELRGERRGSGGGAEGERRGSGGGAEGERRGSGGGAEGERRGSGGGAEGEWRGSGGGVEGEFDILGPCHDKNFLEGGDARGGHWDRARARRGWRGGCVACPRRQQGV